MNICCTKFTNGKMKVYSFEGRRMRTERIKVFVVVFFLGGGIGDGHMNTQNKDNVHTVVKRCMRKELFNVIGEVVKR